MITNAASGTNLHEIAPGIYRINTPVALPDGSGFNFNQYLVADDEPLLFHTGARGLFPLVSFSHFEADECGALNQFLAAAPSSGSTRRTCRTANPHRGRHPRPERGLPRADGLLRPRAADWCGARTLGARAAAGARVHARECVARGWGGVVAGAGEEPGDAGARPAARGVRGRSR